MDQLLFQLANIMTGTVSWLFLPLIIPCCYDQEGIICLPQVHSLTISTLNSDSYPLGFDCANPSTWPSGSIPTYFRADHLEQSPTTPYTLNEFQVSLVSARDIYLTAKSRANALGT